MSVSVNSGSCARSYVSQCDLTEHHETLQPWLVEPWQRSKARTEHTLRALYATSPHELLAYCEKYHITHLLINAARYSADFKKHARLFPPFDAFVDRLLAPVEREQLVIPELAEEAFVFRHWPWIIVDVNRLRAVATGTAGPSIRLDEESDTRPFRRAFEPPPSPAAPLGEDRAGGGSNRQSGPIGG